MSQAPKSRAPKRIYSYGALAPLQPELVAAEIRAAGKYKNRLVALEQERRKRVREAQAAFGDVGALDARVEELKQKMEEARGALRKKQSAARKKVDDPELKARISALGVQLKEARAAAKEARQQIKHDPLLKERYKEIDDWFSWRAGKLYGTAGREARAGAECYWGNYLQVEAAVASASKGPTPPRFHRADGTGRCAVQLQGGLTLPEAYSCKDPRLQIQRMEEAAWRALHRRPMPRAAFRQVRTAGSRRSCQELVLVRIKQKEQWIEVPTILDRPLPEGAIIKWAWLLQRRVGPDWIWRVQFNFALPEDEVVRHHAAPSGSVIAIDLGWRMHKGLRVAYWADGEGGHGQITVPEKSLLQFQKADELRSIRDKNFDLMRAEVTGWLAQQAALPEWLTERTQALSQWRSPGRLVGLLRRWTQERLPGDEALLERLEAWRKQDKHLWLWEAHAREKAAARRLDHYRATAKRLAAQYRTLLVEDFDLRELAQRPKPEQGTQGEGSGLRKTARWAAPGEFRRLLNEAFVKQGGEVKELPAANTTRRCSFCQHETAWDAAPYVYHTCEGCARVWDQDHNACRNLLAASGMPAPGLCAGEEVQCR